LESVVSDQSAAERAEPAAAADAEANIDSLLPMPRPRPVKAPKVRAVAKLGDASIEQPAGEHIEAAATASSSDMQVAKLDAQAVPLPQPRPDLGKTPERDVTPAHRAPHRHVRGTPRKQEPPALIAWFEKLTTPKQAWRRRR
jgi:hypothetical protein